MTSITISYFGLSCFGFEVKNEKEAIFVTDPFSKSADLKLPRNLTADFVTVSSQNQWHNATESVKPKSEKNKLKTVSNPGEYEIYSVFINGFPVLTKDKNNKIIHANTIFTFTIGDMRITHLGSIIKSLSNEEIQNLSGCDVLLLPLSSDPEYKEGPTVKNLTDIVTRIEPRILIPMHYKIPGLKINLNPLEKFLKEIGQSKVEPLKKFKFSKKDLPQEEMGVIVLSKN